MAWGLWIHESKDPDLKICRRIAAFAQSRGLGLYVLQNQHVCSLPGVIQAEQAAFFEDIEILLVLGGDGTILAATHQAAPRGVPMLGINLGHYGFLSECEPEQLDEALDLLARGDYRVEQRIMVRGTVLDAHNQIVAASDALNDIVLSAERPVQLIHAQAKAAGQMLYQCACDGIIVATPTGSTAYSRAAGGPVVPPFVPCLVMTPLCSSSLATCPMVFSQDETIELTLAQPQATGLVSVDGQPLCSITGQHRLRVERSQHTAAMVRIYDKDFYQRLREKWDVWAHDRYQ